MSYRHTASFQVRHYECDPYGQVHYANYLRYMQEAAFAASAAVGYTEARYSELGYQWLAYETNIEYLLPLTYGETFSVQTWVHDFRRVRSLRRYDFHRDGNLVARAATDWVLIDVNTLRPTSVPAEVVAAYADGDPVDPVPRQDSLPQSVRPSDGVFTLQRRVRWRDLDPVAHVNNAVYIHFAEDCGLQVRRAYGWPVSRWNELGCRITVRRHQVEYKLPATLDDELDIATWMSNVTGTTLLRHTTITRKSDGKLLNRVRALCHCIDLESGQPRPIPQAYLDDLKENIGESRRVRPGD
jgi:acyl-CoA thioester hydrolase